MHIFVAGLGTESNTFSPIPTALADFKSRDYYPPGKHPDTPVEQAAPLWVARQRALSEGWRVTEGTVAFAQPAGITTRETYEFLRNNLLNELSEALPVDAVALSMHGAMVADGYPDCEGDVLKQVRKIIGPGVPLGLEIDPHCHLTNAMTEHADVIVIFKEYPHTDTLERADELLDILDGMVKQDINPVMSVHDCRLISIYHTTTEPMKGFIKRIQDLEKDKDILSISVAHGFPWGDVADIGSRMLVVTDNQPQKGKTLARQLGQELYALRGKTYTAPMSIKDGVAYAMAANEGPVVISDTSDNPGGGAPGDSTFILSALLAAGARDVCLGPLWDPVAVQLAFNAGVGSNLKMRIGGKMGVTSGPAVDVEATITALCPDAYQSFSNSRAGLGNCAALHFEGIDLVLSTLRCQALGLDLFTNLGIDPAGKASVVLKSSQHFMHAFGPIASEVIYIDSPGALSLDFASIPYTALNRDIWPRSGPLYS